MDKLHPFPITKAQAIALIDLLEAHPAHQIDDSSASELASTLRTCFGLPQTAALKAYEQSRLDSHP